MKTVSRPENGHVGRREFITATTAGVAAMGLVSPLTGKAAEVQAAPAQFPGTGRYLYVTNNLDKRVDVVDASDGHRLVWSFPWVGAEGGVGGACAHPVQNRIYITHVGDHIVSAYNLETGKLEWQVNTLEQYGLRRPDRITITADGQALYVPMNWSRETDGYTGWENHVNMVLAASNGEKITELSRPGRPHNNWTGEGGRYMYMGGRSDQTMVVADQKTHRIVKTIGQFNWPIRQFITAEDELYLYLTLTRTVGFGVGNIRAGTVLPDVPAITPRERTRYWSASSSGGGGGRLPHGDGPWSHGLGMRPGGSREVFVLDDEWGYLHVYDPKPNPAQPAFKGYIELFDKIDEPWAAHIGNRWVAFSLDGKYCYPSDGSVVDCEIGKKTSMTIAPSEKLLEVEFRSGRAVRCTGQQGGVYGQAV